MNNQSGNNPGDYDGSEIHWRQTVLYNK